MNQSDTSDAPSVDLDVARRVLTSEARSIAALPGRIGEGFAAAGEAILRCRGKVVLTGVGKAGIIGQKISATLASTGTLSIFLHPVEALHGDLGRLERGDVVVALSHSGASEEIIRLLDHIKARGALLVAMTGVADSPLARHAEITICYGEVQEACPHGLAPTVSTTCMLALGDALALTVMQARGFEPENFATFHPGGSLGRKLMKVEEAMTSRVGKQLEIIRDDRTLGDALAEAEKAPRRAGAMVLVDSDGRLSGILTDADLRRALVAHRAEGILDRPVAEFMTRRPKRVRKGDLASEALAVLNANRIDELPVVDEADRPVGIIDVQDLLGIKTLSDGRD